MIVFCDWLQKFVIVYLDEILTYSRKFTKHVRHIRAVLHRLLTHELYVKAEKCEFHVKEVSFLDYQTGRGDVPMDDNKVKAVKEWPEPTTVKELQRFLGFANFYCRFI